MEAKGVSAEKGCEGGLVMPLIDHGDTGVKPEFALEGISGFV